MLDTLRIKSAEWWHSRKSWKWHRRLRLPTLLSNWARRLDPRQTAAWLTLTWNNSLDLRASLATKAISPSLISLNIYLSVSSLTSTNYCKHFLLFLVPSSKNGEIWHCIFPVCGVCLYYSYHWQCPNTIFKSVYIRMESISLGLNFPLLWLATVSPVFFH